MEHAVGILMLALGALILIYAGLLGYVKNPAFIPRSHFAKIRDPQQYAKQFAKLLALVGLGPVVGGLVGLFAGNAAAGNRLSSMQSASRVQRILFITDNPPENPYLRKPFIVSRRSAVNLFCSLYASYAILANLSTRLLPFC